MLAACTSNVCSPFKIALCLQAWCDRTVCCDCVACLPLCSVSVCAGSWRLSICLSVFSDTAGLV